MITDFGILLLLHDCTAQLYPPCCLAGPLEAVYS